MKAITTFCVSPTRFYPKKRLGDRAKKRPVANKQAQKEIPEGCQRKSFEIPGRSQECFPRA